MNQDRKRIIGSQALAKAEMPINYKYDSAGVRMYFSSKLEFVGRFLIFIGIIGNAFTFLFFAGVLGVLSTQSIPFSPLINPIGKPIFEAITLLCTVIGMLFLFVFLIVTLVIKRIRSLIIYGWLFSVLGTLFNSGLIALVFVLGFKAQNKWSIVNLSMSVISLCGWLFGSVFLLSSAYKRRRVLEQAYLSLIRKEK